MNDAATAARKTIRSNASKMIASIFHANQCRNGASIETLDRFEHVSRGGISGNLARGHRVVDLLPTVDGRWRVTQCLMFSTAWMSRSFWNGEDVEAVEVAETFNTRDEAATRAAALTCALLA